MFRSTSAARGLDDAFLEGEDCLRSTGTALSSEAAGFRHHPPRCGYEPHQVFLPGVSIFVGEKDRKQKWNIEHLKDAMEENKAGKGMLRGGGAEARPH